MLTSDVPSSQRERMLAGLPYDPGCAELVAIRKRAQMLMRDYNATVYGDDAVRMALMEQLVGTWNRAVIRPPFYVDYGAHIHFGTGVFVNFGAVMLDVCPITIGDATQIGPNVQILTADHPRDPALRAQGQEWGRPITVGRNVWIGGGAILLPGVTIGDDAIIGAGAVVTRSVANRTTVAGNPARPIAVAQLTEKVC